VYATTKSYALKVLVGEASNKELKCFNMIIKNERMPDGAVSVTKPFGTSEANMETAELVVYESDFMEEYYDVDDYYVLGTATLELPGNLPENAPLEVTFKLRTEGILEVLGRDMTSGKDVYAEMQTKGGMTPEQVEAQKERSKDIVVM